MLAMVDALSCLGLDCTGRLSWDVDSLQQDNMLIVDFFNIDFHVKFLN